MEGQPLLTSVLPCLSPFLSDIIGKNGLDWVVTF